MFVGYFNGARCEISQLAENHSSLITGYPGTGKTTQLNKIELEAAKAGSTVIVIDLHQTHTEDKIFSPLFAEYCLYTNRIHALKDGLNVTLLKAMYNKDGEKEPFFSTVNSAVTSLSSLQNFGPMQIGALRTAICKAIQTRSSFKTESEAIAFHLLQSDDAIAHGVYQRLWTLLNCGVLRPSSVKVQPGKINIFDFSGIDHMTQAILAEIILSNLWRSVCFASTPSLQNGTLVVLDELQNLSCANNSTLAVLLCEGRKFGINLALATQTLNRFSKESRLILGQVGTRLYFRPSPFDIIGVSKEIANYTGLNLQNELSSLQKGECIALGSFCVNGNNITRPILLK